MVVRSAERGATTSTTLFGCLSAKGRARLRPEQLLEEHPADHLVRDDDRPASTRIGDRVECCGSALLGVGVALTVGKGPDVRVAVALVERSWESFVDLCVAQACPVPVVNLGQVGDFDGWQ